MLRHKHARGLTSKPTVAQTFLKKFFTTWIDGVTMFSKTVAHDIDRWRYLYNWKYLLHDGKSFLQSLISKNVSPFPEEEGENIVQVIGLGRVCLDHVLVIILVW